MYRVSGQYERALQAWERLLKISPTDLVYASSNRARIYIYQRDYDKAEAELAKGLAFEPNHPLLRSYVAVVDYYRGQIEKATMVLEDILAKHPELHSQKLFLAYCYMARGEQDRALALIDDRVIEIARADQDAAYRLAGVYALAERADDAIEWLELSISMGNENYPWVATNPNWESMREEPRPTRAEASDVANAILDGSDAVMLSGETSIGEYPIQAVKAMANIAEFTEKNLHDFLTAGREFGSEQLTVTDAIGQATCEVAKQVGAKLIIPLTLSGYSARMIARHRPEIPMFAVTVNPHTQRRLALVWGAQAALIEQDLETDQVVHAAMDAARQGGLVQRGDRVVITAGVPTGVTGKTNMIQVREIE